MIAIELYLAFIAATAILMVIPGPNVALIVANSVAHGTRFGLLTVAATSSAVVVHLDAHRARRDRGAEFPGGELRLAALGSASPIWSVSASRPGARRRPTSRRPGRRPARPG